MKHLLAVWLRNAANRLEPPKPVSWCVPPWTQTTATTNATVTYTGLGNR